MCIGLMMQDPYWLIFSTRNSKAKYNGTLQIYASREVCTTLYCVGLSKENGLSIDATTKLSQYNWNPDQYDTLMPLVNDHQYFKMELQDFNVIMAFQWMQQEDH